MKIGRLNRNNKKEIRNIKINNKTIQASEINSNAKYDIPKNKTEILLNPSTMTNY